jgi:hypothetical protein
MVAVRLPYSRCNIGQCLTSSCTGIARRESHHYGNNFQHPIVGGRNNKNTVNNIQTSFGEDDDLQCNNPIAIFLLYLAEWAEWEWIKAEIIAVEAELAELNRRSTYYLMNTMMLTLVGGRESDRRNTFRNNQTSPDEGT